MAWPSWMPLAARPANWIDWSTTFRAVIPREWPKRLFGGDSQAYSDLIAFGEALALARDWLSFLHGVSLRGSFEIHQRGHEVISGEIEVKWRQHDDVVVTLEVALVRW